MKFVPLLLYLSRTKSAPIRFHSADEYRAAVEGADIDEVAENTSILHILLSVPIHPSGRRSNQYRSSKRLTLWE